MLAKEWIFKISLRTIRNIFVVVLTAVIIFGLGTNTWKEGQDNIASRWCVAFNMMYTDGYVVEDEIFCTSIVRYPLTPALKQIQKKDST